MPNIRLATTALSLLLLAGTAAAQQAPAQVGTFRNWSAYTVTDQRGKQCYVASQPADMQPKNVNRDPVFFLVTSRPAEKIKNEASVVIGYPLKEDSKVSVEIGPQKFQMFVKDDGAWFETPAQEDELIAAMRKGASMVVKGTSRRGTATTDTYPLAGISAALDKIAADCK